MSAKETLEKFNKEVEKAELTRNPYSSEDKKFKHILVSLSEEHFNIFKDILDYITNLQESEAYYYGQYKDYKSRNEKTIEYTKQFINGKTSRIDEWKNVELFLETIVQLLQGEDKE